MPTQPWGSTIFSEISIQRAAAAPDAVGLQQNSSPSHSQAESRNRPQSAGAVSTVDEGRGTWFLPPSWSRQLGGCASTTHHGPPGAPGAKHGLNLPVAAKGDTPVRREEMQVHYTARSYSTFKVRSGSCEKIPLIQGSSILGIRQAKVLEWVAIFFSKGSSPRDLLQGSPTLQSDCLLSEPPVKMKPLLCHKRFFATLQHAGS
ncbi:unnamed protein product [Rangifer tarandus platyrhynchus]|uniref:Uncharacterized protein n=1 Tax=Rangifer tarandus platyrhynchus TaxID=3082113 RepID=A0AC60A120_RANTA